MACVARGLACCMLLIRRQEVSVMYDLLFLVVTIGFTVLSLLYIGGCERL
jgi:hypothetical protein